MRSSAVAHSRGDDMPTYVHLLNWTEQGIKEFRDTTKRAEDFTALVQRSGGKVHEILWTVGEYDLVAIVDYPDEETSIACLLQLGAKGKVRTKTLRAFTSNEVSGIIDRIG